ARLADALAVGHLTVSAVAALTVRGLSGALRLSGTQLGSLLGLLRSRLGGVSTAEVSTRLLHDIHQLDDVRVTELGHRVGRDVVAERIESHLLSLSLLYRACTRGAFLVNTISSLSGLKLLELLLRDSLVRSLRTRHLREDRRSLQLSAEPDQGVHEIGDGVLARVDVCSVAHSVVSPETLIELLHPEHVVQSQIGSRLNNLFSRLLTVDLLDCLQERVLGRNLHHRGARCVLAGLDVIAL